MSLQNLSGRLGFETERTSSFVNITPDAYEQVGPLFAFPIRILVLQNQTNAPITFSLDGVNDTITIQSDEVFTFDITTNRTSQNSYMIAVNSGVWVKGDPTSGSVYVSAFYAVGE